MAIVQCKECGADISSKAETCPKCGIRRKAGSPGCIAGLFKGVGSLIGGLIGLGFGLYVISGGCEGPTGVSGTSDPMGDLRRQCREHADAFPVEAGRQNFYDSCVEGGSQVLANARSSNGTQAKPSPPAQFPAAYDEIRTGLKQNTDHGAQRALLVGAMKGIKIPTRQVKAIEISGRPRSFDGHVIDYAAGPKLDRVAVAWRDKADSYLTTPSTIWLYVDNTTRNAIDGVVLNLRNGSCNESAAAPSQHFALDAGTPFPPGQLIVFQFDDPAQNSKDISVEGLCGVVIGAIESQ